MVDDVYTVSHPHLERALVDAGAEGVHLAHMLHPENDVSLAAPAPFDPGHPFRFKGYRFEVQQGLKVRRLRLRAGVLGFRLRFK
jgi:hypothetical protein